LVDICFVIFPSFRFFFLPEPLGIYRCFKGLTNKLFSTLFPENYSFAGRKNFTRNALQSGEIKRGSPPLRLENQPARTGRNRRRNKMEKIKRRKLIGINEDGWRRGIGR